DVDFPAREEALLAGFLHATTYVRWRVLTDAPQDPATQPTFTEELLLHLERHFFHAPPPPRAPSPTPHPAVEEGGVAWLVTVWAFRPLPDSDPTEAIHVLQILSQAEEHHAGH